jgi:hypothetical protein
MGQKVKVGEGLEIEAEVQRMEVRPGDVVVARCQERIRPEFGVYLRKRLRAAFPDNQVIVIDGGMELQVLGEGVTGE